MVSPTWRYFIYLDFGHASNYRVCFYLSTDTGVKGDVFFPGYYDSEFDWINETAKVKCLFVCCMKPPSSLPSIAFWHTLLCYCSVLFSYIGLKSFSMYTCWQIWNEHVAWTNIIYFYGKISSCFGLFLVLFFTHCTVVQVELEWVLGRYGLLVSFGTQHVPCSGWWHDEGKNFVSLLTWLLQLKWLSPETHTVMFYAIW
jgi:hypothetical protein